MGIRTDLPGAPAITARPNNFERDVGSQGSDYELGANEVGGRNDKGPVARPFVQSSCGA